MAKDFVYTTAISKIRKIKSRIKVIQGGTSAGKTFAILPILIDKAIKIPGLEIDVVATTIAKLKVGAMKDFINIMKMTGRWNSTCWNITDRKYTFFNGSIITFVNADTDKSIGPRRDILFVNEANFIPYHIYDQFATRTEEDIYIDFNPTHRFWAHTDVLMQSNAELIILTYKDNEGIGKNTLAGLLEKKERAEKENNEYLKNWCKVYLDGQIGKLEGAIFTEWNECNSIPENAKLINFGLDFGYTNDPTALVGVYKFDNDLYIDEVIYQKGLLNSEISKLIKQAGINSVIVADSSEPKSIAELNM